MKKLKLFHDAQSIHETVVLQLAVVATAGRRACRR
jgi:hypothetical protein